MKGRGTKRIFYCLSWGRWCDESFNASYPGGSADPPFETGSHSHKKPFSLSRAPDNTKRSHPGQALPEHLYISDRNMQTRENCEEEKAMQLSRQQHETPILLFIFLLLAVLSFAPTHANDIEEKDPSKTDPPGVTSPPAPCGGAGGAQSGNTGSGHVSGPGGSGDYSWGWGSRPGSSWGFGSGSGQTPSGDGKGFGFGFGYGTGSGPSAGYGFGTGGGGDHGDGGGAYGFGGGHSGPGGGGGGDGGGGATGGYGFGGRYGSPGGGGFGDGGWSPRNGWFPWHGGDD